MGSIATGSLEVLYHPFKPTLTLVCCYVNTYIHTYPLKQQSAIWTNNSAQRRNRRHACLNPPHDSTSPWPRRGPCLMAFRHGGLDVCTADSCHVQVQSRRFPGQDQRRHGQQGPCQRALAGRELQPPHGTTDAVLRDRTCDESDGAEGQY